MIDGDQLVKDMLNVSELAVQNNTISKDRYNVIQDVISWVENYVNNIHSQTKDDDKDISCPTETIKPIGGNFSIVEDD